MTWGPRVGSQSGSCYVKEVREWGRAGPQHSRWGGKRGGKNCVAARPTGDLPGSCRSADTIRRGLPCVTTMEQLRPRRRPAVCKRGTRGSVVIFTIGLRPALENTSTQPINEEPTCTAACRHVNARRGHAKCGGRLDRSGEEARHDMTWCLSLFQKHQQSAFRSSFGPSCQRCPSFTKLCRHETWQSDEASSRQH